jgi:hypothetical protein
MATYDSSLYTAQAAALTDYSQAPNLKQAGGNLHILHAQVTLPSVLDSDDDIRIGYLPPTAKVIPALCKVHASATPTNAISLNVGTPTTADVFAKGIAIGTSSVAGVAFDSSNNALTPTKLAANTPVIAKATADVTVGSGKALTFFIAYTLG